METIIPFVFKFGVQLIAFIINICNSFDLLRNNKVQILRSVCCFILNGREEERPSRQAEKGWPKVNAKSADNQASIVGHFRFNQMNGKLNWNSSDWTVFGSLRVLPITDRLLSFVFCIFVFSFFFLRSLVFGCMFNDRNRHAASSTTSIEREPNRINTKITHTHTEAKEEENQKFGASISGLF